MEGRQNHSGSLFIQLVFALLNGGLADPLQMGGDARRGCFLTMSPLNKVGLVAAWPRWLRRGPGGPAAVSGLDARHVTGVTRGSTRLRFRLFEEIPARRPHRLATRRLHSNADLFTDDIQQL